MSLRPQRAVQLSERARIMPASPMAKLLPAIMLIAPTWPIVPHIRPR